MTQSALLKRLREAVTEGVDPAVAQPLTRRAAAVLLLVDGSDAALPLLFMLRSDKLRLHAGQIGFPGGSTEPRDADPIGTALREAREEVGLDPANVDILGTLNPLLTAVSELWLTPVVGLQRGPWDVVADTVEVAEWFRVSIDELMAAPHEVRQMTRDGAARDVHFYTVGERTIWGVTGSILHDLLGRLGRQD